MRVDRLLKRTGLLISSAFILLFIFFEAMKLRVNAEEESDFMIQHQIFDSENNEQISDAINDVIIVNGSGNASRETAKVLTLDTEVTDKIVSTDVSNWYKFSVEKDGYIRGIFEFEAIKSTYLSSKGWVITLFDEAGTEIVDDSAYLDIDAHSIFDSIGIKKGIYYIKVSARDGDTELLNVEYKLLINHTPSDNFEKEPNNRFETANTVYTNTPFGGCIPDSFDSDYYSFTVNENGQLKLSFLQNVSGDDEYYIKLYNSERDEIGEFIYEPYGLYKWDETEHLYKTIDYLAIERGAYYMSLGAHIYSYVNYNNYLYRTPYEIKMTFVPNNSLWLKDYDFEISGSDIVLKKYTGKGGDIVVPAYVTIGETKYNVVIDSQENDSGRWSSNLFFKDNNITSFTAEKGVKLRKAGHLFHGCNLLKSVDISGMDTSESSTMTYMFYGCTSLESINLSGINTRNVTDMSWMFCGCKSLKSIEVSSFDTINVTDMASMFMSCDALTKLDLRNFNTSKVTDMAGMFWDSDNLKEINVSSFDTSKVTSMRSMFSACYDLEKLDLSNFDTSQVTSMWGMFFGDKALKELDLSSFDTRNVTDMTGVFEMCEGIEKINISSWDMSKVEEYAALFSRCYSLKELITPKNLLDANLPCSMYEKNVDGSIGTTEYYKLNEAPANSVLVFVPLENVTLSQTQIVLKVGESAIITMKCNPEHYSNTYSGEDDKKFESSDESVVTIDENGSITAVGQGTATITGGVLYYRNTSDGYGYGYEWGYSKSDTCTVIVNGDSGDSNNPDKPKEYIPSDIDKNLAEGHCLMYRLYNPNTGEHFYTGSKREGNKLVDVGWNYEGIAWEGPVKSNTPVYRLYNPNVGEHHYTPSKRERNNLIKIGWNDEGIGWYSDDNKGKPLYRLYNPNATTGNHHYTTSTRERDKLVKIGWNDEGIGWYGYAQ